MAAPSYGGPSPFLVYKASRHPQLRGVANEWKYITVGS